MANKPEDKPKASGRYRKVEVRTWGDAKFRELSPIPPCGQGLWLFLITGPHTGPIPGLFRAGRAAMAEELGWDLEAFDEAFGEAFRQGMVQADFRARVMWVPNAIKHNKPESPNVVRSWAAEFDLIPECDLKWLAFEALKASIHALGEAYGKAFDETFAKPSGKPSRKATPKTSPNQEQEQEQESSEGKPSDGKPSAASPGSDLPGIPPAPPSPPAGEPDPVKAEIWRSGRKLLTDADVPKRQAGSFIGELVTKFGQPIVLDAVRAAAKVVPPEPRDYLMATCQRMAGERKRQADSADWTRSAE